ncbi:hypothetical protein EVAR_63129_1 [Eumeta japonica]|uniref:Uncharacterized protein n=1 Tax=Eumeta variegata TaxID=151549 RepID=A0A4C2A717_EUMVA|nr:hypothetical protein EVAR_63129_1 [Eumeta japonica]
MELPRDRRAVRSKVHGPLTSLRPRWATGPQETDWHLDAAYLLRKGATVEGVDINFVGGRDGWDSIRFLVKKNNTTQTEPTFAGLGKEAGCLTCHPHPTQLLQHFKEMNVAPAVPGTPVTACCCRARDLWCRPWPRRLSLVHPLPPAAAPKSEAHGASPGCAVYPWRARCHRPLLQISSAERAVRDVTPDHPLLPPLLTIPKPVSSPSPA